MQFPELWISNIQQSGLLPIAAYYLWRGLAPSTRRNYDTPRSRFTLFCTLSNFRHLNGDCFPAKTTWLIEWLYSLAGTVKVKMMKLYLSGIKSYQLDLGIDCTIFADPDLREQFRASSETTTSLIDDQEHLSPGHIFCGSLVFSQYPVMTIL